MSDTARSFWIDVTILVLAGCLFVTMISLGNWQVRRLAWKLDLIEQVEARAFGDPVTTPLDTDALEYLRVVANGTFDHEASLLVKAVTEAGSGFWVMTPLQTPDQTLWINRGFVPTGLATSELSKPNGPVQIIGLIRADQPGGTLLERNKPKEDRWVSVDLTEMNRVAGINNAQHGYFIDDEAKAGPGSWPRGGLTRLTFRNTHLVYAITWYAMALLFLIGMAYVIKERIKARGT